MMLEQQNEPRSPAASFERGDGTRPDADDGIVDVVPATGEIDLGIEPVAYRYESWSEMADGWVESLRSTAKTMPDPDHDRIRDVTPLVPLSEVEVLVDRMLMLSSGEADVPHDRADATGDTSRLR